MDNVHEAWRPVVGYEGLYMVSSLGRFYSRTRTVATLFNAVRRIPGRFLKPKINSRSGYVEVMLYQPAAEDSRRKTVRAHKLVARAFLGPPPPGTVVNHKDFDRTNNTVANLEYLSQRENVRHAAAAGRTRVLAGEDVGRSVLTEAQVRRFRALAETKSIASIARTHGFNYSTVYHAIRGRNWGHVK